MIIKLIVEVMVFNMDSTGGSVEYVGIHGERYQEHMKLQEVSMLQESLENHTGRQDSHKIDKQHLDLIIRELDYLSRFLCRLCIAGLFYSCHCGYYGKSPRIL